MKIAIVCDVLGKENNGTTIASMNLIRSLKAKGHEVRIVCPDAERAGEAGFFIVPRYNFGPINGYVSKNGVVPAKADMKVLEKAFDGIDHIHVMLPFSLGKASARYAKEHGISLTAGFHCQAENITSHIKMKNFSLANKIAYKVINKRLYRYCDCVHYPTQFICDVFEKIVGNTPHEVISNGVCKEFKPHTVSKNSDVFKVLFIGRYSKEKSHKVLIDAVSKSKYKDRIQLIFAGAGPLENELKSYAKKRGIIMPIMKFYSRVELIDVINEADLYVHPAEIEIEAIACLEAIACGKVPLIADSPRSATRYFALDEMNLFHYNDSKNLAEKLDLWLENDSMREEYSKKYSNYSKQFDFDLCMDKMEEMILRTYEEKKKC